MLVQKNNQFSLHDNYILCGSGRWGSADHWLGIPVNWKQISQAKTIIELGRGDLPIDPSFGSHFFQNITSLHVAYFTIDHKKDKDYLDTRWLSEEKIYKKGEYVDWYKFEEPFIIKLDGMSGLGIVQKPVKPEIELMNEEESTGI